MSFPLVQISEIERPYWDGLTGGELRYQRCLNCHNRWLPAREHCPRCLDSSVSWDTSTGRGKIISWVVYHIAYHQAFESKLPYNVTIVELTEGPRLLTNIVQTAPAQKLVIGAPVQLVIEYEGEQALARFRLSKAVEEPT